MAQIALTNITKTFKVAERPTGRFSMIKGAFIRKIKEVYALDNVSFSIEQGELVGYIGPNGAGKSTTVKVMSGILTPDCGECEIMGKIPWKNRVSHVSQIGVVFGQRSQLWWDVPVSDSFNLLKDIYDISSAAYKDRLKSLIQALNIESLLKTPVRQLSLGQRMRCEITAALLHSPKILFLDEPTIGLDAVSKIALRDFLKTENKQNGVTMILTTHDMDDIEALCDRVMVIGRGKILYNGDLSDLRRKYSPLRRIKATMSVPVEHSQIQINGASKIETEDENCIVWFNPEEVSAHRIVADMAERLPLTDITIEEQNIDEMIAAMYQEMKL